MGTAILAGVIREATKPHREEQPWRITHAHVSVTSDVSADRLKQVFSENLSFITIYNQDNLSLCQNADVIILGFKPAQARGILGAAGIGEAVRGKILISVLAGLSTKDTLAALATSESAEKLDEKEPATQVVRTMPNTGAKEGASMTVVATPAEGSSREAVDLTRWVFDHVGQTQEISESLFNIGGSFVGCSGAMFTIAIDGLLDQCVAEGMRRSDAQSMMASTLLGLVKLLEKGDSPSVIREEVSSPGGGTIRALLELERQGVRSAFSSALAAVSDRARELGSK